MRNFILIGAAGYVAPRHMEAVKAVGGRLLAALDPNDSVGILDRYFPECRFFTEFERFDRYVDLCRRRGNQIDYCVVCSPNYLHDAHCRFGLRIGADVICEKPLTATVRNLDQLAQLEAEGKGRVWTILQCRLHSAVSIVLDLVRGVDSPGHLVNVNYVTPRGHWYHHSWKGNVEKSGGLATNIGVHLFDLMAWMFGHMDHLEITEKTDETVSGVLFLKNATVNFRLSVSMDEEPQRLFTIDDIELDLTTGFDQLHTRSYLNILDGKGFGVLDAREAIRICEEIRRKGTIHAGPIYGPVTLEQLSAMVE